MIPQHAAQVAIDVAQQLDAANRRIVVVADTPLALLVETSTVQLNVGTMRDPHTGAVVVETSDEWQPDAATIEADSRLLGAGSDSMSQHDQLMDELITDSAALTAQHLSFAKNTVRPIIKQFVDQAAQALAAYPDQGSFSPALILVDMPAVILSPAVLGEVKAFEGVAIVDSMGAALKLPQLSNDAVLALLQTGSVAVDDLVAAWVQSKGEDFFLRVYTEVFGPGTGEPGSIDRCMYDPEIGQDYMAAAFLMGRALLDSIPPESPYTLVQYRSAVGTVIEQTAARLNRALYMREMYLNQQNLVLSWNGKDRAILLKPVYDDWIAGGGMQAILLGNLLLSRPNTTVPAMLQDQELCLQTWEQHNRFLTETLKNRKHESSLNTLKFIAQTVLAENLEVIFGQILPGQELSLTVPRVAECLKCAQELIGIQDEAGVANLWGLAIQVVAGCFFSYSAADAILGASIQISKDNPDIDPAECELLAVVDYVCEYVADMMDLRDL